MATTLALSFGAPPALAWLVGLAARVLIAASFARIHPKLRMTSGLLLVAMQRAVTVAVLLMSLTDSVLLSVSAASASGPRTAPRMSPGAWRAVRRRVAVAGGVRRAAHRQRAIPAAGDPVGLEFIDLGDAVFGGDDDGQPVFG